MRVKLPAGAGAGPLFCLLSIMSLAGETPTKPKLRVFLLNPTVLQENRQRIWTADKTLAPALAELKKDADRSLEPEPFSVIGKTRLPPSKDKHDYMSEAPYYWPNPDTADGLPYVRKDGERNPGIYEISDRRNLGRMCSAVETLALAYYFTTNEIYADRAAVLLRTWFLDPATRMNPSFQFAQAVRGQNTGRGTGLIEAVSLTAVVDAVGLLAGSKTWTERDQRGLEDWFSRFRTWMIESPNGRAEGAAKNNHGSFYDVQVVSFSLFLGNTNEARRVLEEAKQKRIAKQIEPDGRQPLELERTRSWSYSLFNLRALFSLASLGDRVDVDLWNFQTTDGRSIRKALDFLVPYGLKQKKWSYRQLGSFTAQDLFPLLRQAAVKYPESQYQKLLAKTPPSSSSSRANLLQPSTAPN